MTLQARRHATRVGSLRLTLRSTPGRSAGTSPGRSPLPALLLGCVLSIAVAQAASADPVVFTAGTWQIAPLGTSAVFTLSGPDATFVGRWPNGGIQASGACGSCGPGAPVTPNARFAYEPVPFVPGDPFASGRLVLGGTDYGQTYLQGQMQFSGPSFAMPTPAAPYDDTTRVSVWSPFTLIGTVSGYATLLQGPHTISPVFTESMTGRGLARVDFIASPGPRTSYTYLQTTYEFQPVPEPATFMLLSGGLMTWWSTRWIGRRRGAPRDRA